MTEPFEFARRTDWSLTPNRLIASLERLRAQKIPLIDLTESNPTHCQFSFFSEKIISALNDTENLNYRPSPQGQLNAREAVGEYYRRKGYKINPQRIFLTSSTSEAYSALFRLLLEPQESVLVPTPSYPLFEFLVKLNDCSLQTYPLVYREKWSLDAAALAARLSSLNGGKAIRPKVIIVVNPNNPTGSYLKAQEVSVLNALCRESSLAIISDEVFADYAFYPDQKRHSSLIENDSVLTFVLGGISKSLALPQMKLSWIVLNGPEELVKQSAQRLEVVLDTYLSVNSPSQNALSAWLSLQTMIQEEILKRLKSNRAFLEKRLTFFSRCQLLHSQGGWYVVVKLPATLSEEEWALKFLEEDRVFVHPGYFFDFAEEAFIVTSLLPTEELFQEGWSRILQSVGSHP